jgi:hypothetical protein
MTISPLVLRPQQGNAQLSGWPQRKQGIQRNPPLHPTVQQVPPLDTL